MKKKEEPQQIQLELPDYSHQYEEWLRKKEENKTKDGVVIIDLF